MSLTEQEADSWSGITWDLWAAAVVGLTDDDEWRLDVAEEMAVSIGEANNTMGRV